MMRVSDLFLSLAQMDTEKLRAVNIAEDASRSDIVIFDDENSDTALGLPSLWTQASSQRPLNA